MTNYSAMEFNNQCAALDRSAVNTIDTVFGGDDLIADL